MGAKTDQRVASEMRAFAQGAEKKIVPPKPARVFEEDDYVADVSVKQRPRSRVVYVEDIIDDEPPKTNKPPHHAPKNESTDSSADNNGTGNETEDKRQGNGNNSHKPPASTKQKKEAGTGEKPPKAKQPPATPARLPATGDVPRCISKISNLIRDDLQDKKVFNELNFNGKQKINADSFYKRVGNTIYNSLLLFLDIERYEDGKDPKTGRQLWGFTLPTMSKDIPHIGTWYFLDRAYHNQAVSWETDVTIMVKYRRVFQDHDGIDIEWLETFRQALKEKFFSLSNSSLNTIIDAIRDTWCSSQDSQDEPDEVEDVAVLQAPASAAGYAPDDDGDDDCGDQLRIEEALDPLQYPDDEDDDDDGDDGEEDENNLNIELERYEGLDMLTIIPRNHQSITFYVDIDNTSTNDDIPSLGDDRNGIWDWLMHFVPNMIFRTLEPEKYLPEDPEPVEDTKIIVLDETDGLYTMGIYYLDADFGNEVLEDGSEDVAHRELLWKINNIVKQEMGSASTSHRNVTLGMERLFWDEEDILEYIGVYHDMKDGMSETAQSDDDDTPSAIEESSDAFADAINKATAVASGESPPEPEEDDVPDADDDVSPDPEDDPPYPGDEVGELNEAIEENYNHDDSSDFIFKPMSKKNKYS